MTPRKGKPPTPEYQTQGPAPHRLASGVRR